MKFLPRRKSNPDLSATGSHTLGCWNLTTEFTCRPETQHAPSSPPLQVMHDFLRLSPAWQYQHVTSPDSGSTSSLSPFAYTIIKLWVAISLLSFMSWRHTEQIGTYDLFISEMVSSCSGRCVLYKLDRKLAGPWGRSGSKDGETTFWYDWNRISVFWSR
jgi:hypothetical protein